MGDCLASAPVPVNVKLLPSCRIRILLTNRSISPIQLTPWLILVWARLQSRVYKTCKGQFQTMKERRDSAKSATSTNSANSAKSSPQVKALPLEFLAGVSPPLPDQEEGCWWL